MIIFFLVIVYPLIGAFLSSNILDCPAFPSDVMQIAPIDDYRSGMFGCVRNNRNICSNLGMQIKPSYHHGIDIKVDSFQAVYSAYDGEISNVVRNCKNWSFDKKQLNCGAKLGNQVSIKSVVDGANIRIVYGHLSDKFPSRIVQGQSVQKGDVIGYIAKSGNAAGHDYYHVHIKTLYEGRVANPIDLLKIKVDSQTGIITQNCNMSLTNYQIR